MLKRRTIQRMKAMDLDPRKGGLTLAACPRYGCAELSSRSGMAVPHRPLLAGMFLIHRNFSAGLFSRVDHHLSHWSQSDGQRPKASNPVRLRRDYQE